MWSSQLNSVKWIIIQQFTARADLFNSFLATALFSSPNNLCKQFASRSGLILSVFIWIQTIWHSDSIPEIFFWKSSFWKKSADNKAWKITQHAMIKLIWTPFYMCLISLLAKAAFTFMTICLYNQRNNYSGYSLFLSYFYLTTFA